MATIYPLAYFDPLEILETLDTKKAKPQKGKSWVFTPVQDAKNTTFTLVEFCLFVSKVSKISRGSK